MKKSLLCICMALAFVSCEKIGYGPDAISLLNFQIIKFEKPEYADYLIVYQGLAGQNIYQASAEMLKSDVGENPYIYLGDGYYLVKWSWKDLYPCYRGGVPPIYLISTKWTDIKTNEEYYVNSDSVDIITLDPAIEYYTISYKALDKEFGTHQEKMMPEKYADYLNMDVRQFTDWIYNLDYNINPRPEGADDYLAACDSVANIYTEMIIRLYQENPEKLFSLGSDGIPYYNQLKNELHE